MRLSIFYVLAVLAAIIRADLDPSCGCVVNAGQEPYEAFCVKSCHDKNECDKFTVYCKWEKAGRRTLFFKNAKGCNCEIKPQFVGSEAFCNPYCKDRTGCENGAAKTYCTWKGSSRSAHRSRIVLPLEKSSAKLKKKCPWASAGCGQDKVDYKLGLLPHSYCQTEGHCCSIYGGCSAKICGAEMHLPFYDYKGCFHHALKPNHGKLTPPKCPFASAGCGKNKMDHVTDTLYPESFCQAEGHCCNEWGGCGTTNCKETCAYGPCGSEEWRRYDFGGCIRGTKHGKSGRAMFGKSKAECKCITKPQFVGSEAFCNPYCEDRTGCQNGAAKTYCDWKGDGPDPSPKPPSPPKDCPSNPKVLCDNQCGYHAFGIGHYGEKGPFYCGKPGECCTTSGQCTNDEGICKLATGFSGKFNYGCPGATYPTNCNDPKCNCEIKPQYVGSEAFCNPYCEDRTGCESGAAKTYCTWKGSSRSAHRSRSASKNKIPILLKMLKAIDADAENFQDVLYGTDMDKLKQKLFK